MEGDQIVPDGAVGEWGEIDGIDGDGIDSHSVLANVNVLHGKCHAPCFYVCSSSHICQCSIYYSSVDNEGLPRQNG